MRIVSRYSTSPLPSLVSLHPLHINISAILLVTFFTLVHLCYLEPIFGILHLREYLITRLLQIAQGFTFSSSTSTKHTSSFCIDLAIKTKSPANNTFHNTSFLILSEKTSITLINSNIDKTKP